MNEYYSAVELKKTSTALNNRNKIKTNDSVTQDMNGSRTVGDQASG